MSQHQQEIWKWVEGYPNYAISNFGKVRRRAWLVKKYARMYVRGGNELKQYITPFGYVRVKLFIFDGHKTGKLFPVHRLVASHFVNNFDNKPFVNHLDCNKSNNHYSNLEWCTAVENQQHALLNNRYRPVRGSANNLAKLTEEQVLEIRKIKKESQIFDKDLGKMYNVSQPAISNIINRKAWKHLK